MAGTAGTYELGKFSGVCAASGATIAQRAPFIAALLDVIDEEGHPILRRLDYSTQAWDGGCRPDGLVCFWRSLAPVPGEKRQAFVDDETLLEMVQRVIDENDARQKAFRWILALVLLRRKVLRLDGIIHDGAVEHWAFRPRGSALDTEPIRIANPGIREEEVRELADQLGDVIRTDQ